MALPARLRPGQAFCTICGMPNANGTQVERRRVGRPLEFPERLPLRLTEEQRSALDYYSEKIGDSRSALVRQFIDLGVVVVARALADEWFTPGEVRQIVDDAIAKAQEDTSGVSG